MPPEYFVLKSTLWNIIYNKNLFMSNFQWTEFGTIEGFTGMTAGDGQITDNGASYPIFVNVAMPAAVNNQPIVQVKVFIATNVNRPGASPLQIGGGNTSINNIIFEAVEN